MQLQTVLAPEPQSAMMFGQPEQSPMAFPVSLAERYQPRKLADFIDLDRPKKLLLGLVKRPRPIPLLFIGPPGAGKSVMGMTFSEELPGSLHHVSAQKCDVATLDALHDKFAYSPPRGGFWVCLVDEADQMTEKAQLQFASRLDGTASLTPQFGGGYVRGTPPPVIWVFTANGVGPDHTDPPREFTARFLSRNIITPCPAASKSAIALHLADIWKREGGGDTPESYFDYMADGVGVRDALNRLESDLLCGCRPAPRVASPIALVPSTSPTLNAAQKAWQTRRARKAS